MIRNICLLAFFLLFACCGTAPAQNKLQFSIPFTLVDNRPFIEVKIKNKTLHFILDCGATDVIDVTTARALHLKLENESTTSGAGAKRMPSWETTVDTTRIGKATLVKRDFNVVDLSEIKNKLHLPYLDGAIGYNFMKDYVVQFDYPNHTVNFYSSYTGTDGIPFSMYYHIPKLKATIDGNPPPSLWIPATARPLPCLTTMQKARALKTVTLYRIPASPVTALAGLFMPVPSR